MESLGNLNNRAEADFPLPGHFDLNAKLLGCPNWVVGNSVQGEPAHGWRKTNLIVVGSGPRHTLEAQNGGVPIFNSDVVEGRSIFGGSKGVRVFGQLNLDHFWPKFEPGSIGWHYHQSFRVSWKSCSQGLKETEPILGVACPRRVQEAHIGGGPASSRDWGVGHGWKTGGTEVY